MTETRAQLRSINLRMHDLRHEAGSRLIEAGWPVHHVKEMLGHASLAQTDTYLNPTLEGLKDSMRRSDEARARCNPVANEPPIEHRPHCNDDDRVDAQTVVN